MSKKVAIVTGLSGMDGTSITHLLLSKGYTVVGTYRKNTQLNLEDLISEFPVNADLHLEYCDVADFNSVRILYENVIKKHGKVDEVYLLAAQSHVGNSFSSAESTVITNGMSVYHFLENLRLLTPKSRFYFAATSELLGGDPKNCPFDEKSEYECRSPYSVGKELGTRWVKYFRQTYGTFACYGILFNHSNCQRGKSFYIRRVTNSAARIYLGKQQELTLGCLDFWRDEHWSDFGTEVMWKMLQLEEPDTFIVCRGECFHGEQFLDEAFTHFNLNWRKYVKFDKNLIRPNEVVKLVGNPQKVIKKLNWNPNRMSFKDHIRLMCNWDLQVESGKTPVRPNVLELFPNNS
jgi:GDPmannose 4,6-dehydratase